MTEGDPTGERFMRFHELYGEVVKDEFDPLEFAEDDFYAFQVLDRAFRSDNQELRNLAAHLQTQREAALETITLRATEILESTRKLKTVELKVLEKRGDSGDLGPPKVDVDFPADDEAGAQPALVRADNAAAGKTAEEPGRKRKGWFN